VVTAPASERREEGKLGERGKAPAGAPGKGEALHCEELRKAFGGVHAVDGATFSVPSGSISALIGPNGAGKSTVVNLLSGAIGPDGGRAWLFGREITGWPAHKVCGAGLVRTFQLSRELGRLTVLENLMVTPRGQLGESLFNIFFRPGAIRAEERRHLARALEVLGAFGLYEVRDNYARELSGGQKRLLELARAVMAEPRLLLLDEPMAGINPALVEQIGEHIRRLNADGATVLMVEHNLNVVETICDRVIVMAEGKALATGTMAELRAHPDVVRAYLGAAQSASAAR
jgi:ABC-type branched-subunit amino acid transport system ATPase component